MSQPVTSYADKLLLVIRWDLMALGFLAFLLFLAMQFTGIDVSIQIPTIEHSFKSAHR